jgi:hypothetical protein
VIAEGEGFVRMNLDLRKLIDILIVAGTIAEYPS